MEQTAREIETEEDPRIGFAVWVAVPDDYTMLEAESFKRLVFEALQPVIRDAQMDIDTKRVSESEPGRDITPDDCMGWDVQ